MTKQYDIAVVGAGFTGLSAAHSLAKNGYRVKLIEQEGHLVDEIRKNDSDVVFNTQVSGVSLTQNRIACLNTNYAVREGRAIAAHIHQQVQQKDM